MKTIRSHIIGFWLLALCATVGIMPLSAAPTQPMKGVVRVKLQPEVASSLRKVNVANTTSGMIATGLPSLDASIKKIKGVKMRPVFPCPPGREAAHAEYGLDRWYEITIDESVNPLEAKFVLNGTPGVQTATTRVPMKLMDGNPTYRVLDPSFRGHAPSSAMPFNDPRLAMQWHYNNDGSMHGAVAGADINLFKAWQITTGSPKVTVAIIDGGIDYTHEDLAGAMWVNQAELRGQEGVDDDGDGYIDNIYGFNFCTGKGQVYPHPHGTHVAGTVGAINNNGIGVAGVAGGDGSKGSGVKLMSCQVFDNRSGAGQGDFAAAFVFAADMGATIAQCSWGWDTDGYYEQDVLDAISYFTNTARSDNMVGGLCIFASGNTGDEAMYYPACLDEVIAVGAMTYDMLPANYSTYGSWVDVTAPGGQMDFDSDQGVLSTLPSNQYGFNQGSSMAAPHVSGIAALILSKFGAPTLINETVRQQLLTSVNDFYTANPEAEGLFGSGYIDAYKALQWGDGSAPEAVADLKVISAQDNATLSWTIPVSSDNHVNSHIIYYSKDNFDENSLDKCKAVVVDTKFASSGDHFTYDITGLEALTTYYFAVRAIDRWSHSSPLSPIVSATTNEGPKMTLSRTAMTIRTRDGETWTAPAFDIGNDAEGLLKWSSSLRTISSTISPLSVAKGLMTHPFSGKISIEPCEATPIPTPEDIADFTREAFPRSISNFTQIYAFIGDNATTNSMAQLFTVNAEKYPDGFNLTHVFIVGTYGKNPVIEIYRNAGTLNNSTLLQRMELKSDNPYYTDIPLTENLFFNPGESFYIVVHFTEYNNRNYPLGLGLSNGSSDASHAYMSNDLGKTWSDLSAALKGSSYEEIAPNATWAITAKSQYPDWSQILTLDPPSGIVEHGQKMTVTARHNGTPIPNGSYRARIHLTSNETPSTDHTVNVTITVEGNKPKVDYSKIVQFGNVLVGQSKTIEVEVSNTGYGSFAGSSNAAGIYASTGGIMSTSPHFSGPNQLPYGIPSRSTVTIPVTYTPTEAGSHTGQVIFKDKDGRELKINVQGAATDPAKIAFAPAIVEVGDLVDGADARDVSFKISNTGAYPLQFVMPKYTDTVLDEVSSDKTHRFGYNWTSNLYGSSGADYDGAPRLINPVDVSGDFSDFVYFSRPIEIGFSFPFFGKTYDRLYISSLGLITFDTYTEGSIYSPVSEATTSYLTGLGVISAYGFQCMMAPDSRVEYGRQDGNFIVNFKNVLVLIYDGEYTTASFHIVLTPSGDISISYDNYDPEEVFEKGRNLWVGIVDPAMIDPLTVTSSRSSSSAVFADDTSEWANRWRYIKSGTTFHISAPRPDMIASITPASGVVAPGESIDVTASVRATANMYAGPTSTDLVVLSNDLKSPTSLVKFNANVTGDLKPALSMGSDVVDFGKVFRTSTARYPLAVHNRGRSAMTLTGVSVADGRFTHDFTSQVTILPGQSKDVIITLPTVNEGAVSDRMTITTSAGEATVTLIGEVIGTPAITLSYTEIDETLASGDSKKCPLTISNEGNEDLVYSIVPGEHLRFNPEFENGSRTSYTYTTSVDYPQTKRDWIDIETNGLGEQNNFTYYLKHDYVEVNLPFEFPFYGKKYRKMYVYNVGFVSFTELPDNAIWPEPPGDFPQGTVYTNLIAPYWGLHSMHTSSDAGTYHYVTQDQAVVSFMQYGNSMNAGVDFQLVLHKDGSFWFNYKPDGPYAIIFGAFGIAGISNENGTEGLALPERYISFGNTVSFVPVVESSLAPGEQRVADITVNADVLAGEYQSALTLNTNVPSKESIQIPLQLTVTGEASPVFPEDITVEQVAGYRSGDTNDELIGYYGACWYVPFEIANDGKRAFTITDVKVDCPKVGGIPMFSLYWYGTYLDEWFGNETTGWTTYRGDKVDVGSTPVRFAIPITTSDPSFQSLMTPGVYDIKLTFAIKGLESQGITSKELSIKLIISEQPTIAIDRDEICVEGAPDKGIIDKSFIISNTEGSALKYSLLVDPTGVGAALPDDEATNPYNVRHRAVGKDGHYYDTPDDLGFDYLRALYWPTIEGSTAAYNYGSGNNYMGFTAATGFEGPEGGFNISHIYTAMHPYGLDNKDIKIEIINGDPQFSDDVIGTGTYHVGTVDTALGENIRTIVQLDRPVFVSEGQKFYVKITYPAGQQYPSTLSMKDGSVVSNRYLGYVESYGWFDIATLFSEQYGSLGFVTTCIETVEGDAWIKLLDTEGNTVNQLDGEIAVGGSTEVNVRLNAEITPHEANNLAVVIVKSNDPKQPVINFPVILSKNSTPTVAAAAEVIAVPQGTSAETTVTIIDADNDAFTVKLIDNGQGMARFSSFNLIGGEGSAQFNADKSECVVTSAPAGIEFKVFIEAPLDAAVDLYSFTVTAEDRYGREGSATVKYSVEHVNHAPEAVAFDNIELAKGTTSDVISLVRMFSDSDNDQLTYDYTLSRSNVASVYRNDNLIIIRATNIGTTELTVTATDPAGLSATNKITIKVSNSVGVDNIDADAGAELYPNPVKDVVNVATGIPGETKVELYNMAGKEVYSTTYEAMAASPRQINIGALPQGFYLVKITAATGDTINKVIIKL